MGFSSIIIQVKSHMERKRFTENPTIKILNEAEAEMIVNDLCRKHDFSKSSFYTWMAKFRGIDA